MKEIPNQEMAEEIEIEAVGIEIDSQPIELYKILKIANAVSGGGEAKYAISEGYVAVNGDIEQRKRRKIYDGDLIEFNQEFYLIICDQPVEEVVAKPKTKSKSPKKEDSVKPVKRHQPSESEDSAGRSKIKFF